MRLTVEKLDVTLGGRAVLRDVSLALEPGTIVGLLGPNGAGKSTLMRAIAGRLQGRGTIMLGPHDLATLKPARRARLMAYLPQERTIGWRLSVRDLVSLGRLPWRGALGRANESDKALIERAMALLDVEDLATRIATELSGGEQARVLTARAVAQSTPLLLADEPASGLDPAHQMTMMHALRRLAREEGQAIFVSLHDLTLAARWCDRIIMMKDGRIAADGAPRAVMTARHLSEIYGVTAHIAEDADGLILAPTGLVDKAGSQGKG